MLDDFHFLDEAEYCNTIGMMYAGSLIALASFPVYLAFRGVPSALELGVFAWLVAPILVSYFLSRTGRYESAHVLSSLSLTGLVAGNIVGFVFANRKPIQLPFQEGGDANTVKGYKDPIINDVLFAHACPAGLSRFDLAVLPAARAEKSHSGFDGETFRPHRGSGLWISTAMGSTTFSSPTIAGSDGPAARTPSS